MIDLHFAATPNAWKVAIMLEETGLPYRLEMMDLIAGDHRAEAFLAINPNGKIPVLTDHEPDGGGPSRTIFESGAILLYLARKSGRFMPEVAELRDAVHQWLFWQASALGPILGQYGHFKLYALDQIPYAIDRFGREARRLYGVLDSGLGATGAYVGGPDYSIADMACFPWIMTHKAQGFTLDDFPNIRRWFADLRARPAVVRATALGKFRKVQDLDPQSRRTLFGLDDDAGKSPRTDD